MKTKRIALFLCALLLFVGCGGNDIPGTDSMGADTGSAPAHSEASGAQGAPADLGDDSKTFGSSLDELGAYVGYYEGESADITVTCESGTPDAYRLEGSTLTFTAIGEDTVYSLSGTFRGNIVIDVGDSCKFDLELCGFSQVCNAVNPITVKSGDEVAIQAKKDTQNYIYDMRAPLDPADETLYSGAIHSEVDLEISGKGALTVISENNNGIHSKDDLQVKNLTLLVACADNALKGNDSVEITGGSTTLIASAGDCIKTSNSDISAKGNQRGTVTVTGGTHTLYAACDGIDAAYDAVIDDSSTVLQIFTDKYSNYSREVTAAAASAYYIRFTSNAYTYSVKYSNSDSDFTWVNAAYHSSVNSGRSTYYYYSFPKETGYSKMQFY